MSDIAQDFASLLPKQARTPDRGPIYYLWVFDPHTAKVHLEHNEGRHHADHVDHRDLAKRVPHPDRVHGYAYRIKNGWRITTWEHRPVDDAHILESVRKALRADKAAK